MAIQKLVDLFKVEENLTEQNFPSFFAVPSVTGALTLIKDPMPIKKATDMIKTYLSATVDAQWNLYYDAVEAADTKSMALKASWIESKKEPSTQEIADAMELCATALVYRRESYTLAPTVTHVVRIMQEAGGNAPLSNCKDDPTKPVCSIGSFGFLFSALEQLGYMLRFHKSYCVYPPFNVSRSEKCFNKLKKYQLRFDDAVKRLLELEALHISEEVHDELKIQAEQTAKLLAPAEQSMDRGELAPGAPVAQSIERPRGGTRNSKRKKRRKSKKRKNSRVTEKRKKKWRI